MLQTDVRQVVENQQSSDKMALEMKNEQTSLKAHLIEISVQLNITRDEVLTISERTS
jgi:hypothetical protein